MHVWTITSITGTAVLMTRDDTIAISIVVPLIATMNIQTFLEYLQGETRRHDCEDVALTPILLQSCVGKTLTTPSVLGTGVQPI